jgi:hypothetical protein
VELVDGELAAGEGKEQEKETHWASVGCIPTVLPAAAAEDGATWTAGGRNRTPRIGDRMGVHSSGPADLAEFRLVRALRSGQAGAFPTLWNAQVGAIWSVIRALTADDREAVGWTTSFRVELSERAPEMGTSEPMPVQVGLALFRHLKDGFPGVAPLPDGPIPPTEAGLRQIPPQARLLYLVDLFFDVPVDPLERLAGQPVRRLLDTVHRLMEPSADTDARLYVHAALMRPAPMDVLFLPPGLGPPPPRPRWWIPVVAGGLVLALAAVPWIQAWVERPDEADLVARHRAALEDAPLRGDDPAAMGRELARRDVPAVLTEVPDLSGVGLTLFGASLSVGAETAVILTYVGERTLWTLQHLDTPPVLEGPTIAVLPAERGGLEARRVGGEGGAVVVAWTEGATTWVLIADAPPGEVLARAAAIRETRAHPSIPFLGDTPVAPKGADPE